jgi:hypothetical protein
MNKINALNQVRLLVVVEGTNDTQFLRRISRVLSREDPKLPNLGSWEDEGRLVFIPFGGGHVQAWTNRLTPLGISEFHLYDHELPPESEHRQAAAALVNRRPRAHAVLTAKRSLENYLHPAAIEAAGNIVVEYDDFDPVARIVAKQLYGRRPVDTPWELHSKRAQNRMTQRAKQWLNTVVAEQMTTDLLRERDPRGEIASWLRAMRQLASMNDSASHPTPTEKHDDTRSPTGGADPRLLQRHLDSEL